MILTDASFAPLRRSKGDSAALSRTFGSSRSDHVQEHAALATELADLPEQRLADPDDPVSSDLVAACAETSYISGSLYLKALQARHDAARIGSATGIMRFTQAVNSARSKVQEDAALTSDVPPADETPALPGPPAQLVNVPTASGPTPTKRAVLNHAPLAALVGAAVFAAAAWWFADAFSPGPKAERVDGSEQAHPQPATGDAPVTQQAEAGPAAAPEFTHSVRVDGSRAAAEPPPRTILESPPQEAAPSEADAISPETTAGAELRPEGQMSLVVPPPGAPLPEAPPSELLFTPAASAVAVAPAEGRAVAPEQLAARAGEGITLEERALFARAEPQVPPPSALAPPEAGTPGEHLTGLEVAMLPSPVSVPDGDNRDPPSPEGTLPASPELHAQAAQVEPPPDQKAEVQRVRGETVRMRRAPSLAAPTLALFTTNDEMVVDRTEGEWSHVTAPDGRSGWMANEYLTSAAIAGGGTTAGKPGEPPRPAADRPEGDAGAGGPAQAEGPPADFIVDTVPPPAPGLGPAPDSGVTADGITNRPELALTGTAEAESIVTVRDGDTMLGTAPTDGSGNWSFTTGNLSEGVHSLTASTADSAGNASAGSTALAVTVDTQPPAVTLAAVKSDTTDAVIALGGFTNDNTPTLSGTAEAGSAVEVVLRRAGSPDVVLAPPLSGTEWTVTPDAPLTDGPYRVTVKATDKAGNVAEISAELLK